MKFGVFAIILILFGVGNVSAESFKVLVNHAPKVFYEVLKTIDSTNVIIPPDISWFAPSEAEIWVYFIGHSGDVLTFPELVQKARISVIDNPNPTTLFRLSSPTKGDLRILLVDMTKVQIDEEFGFHFQASIAAHDVLRVALKIEVESGSSL